MRRWTVLPDYASVNLREDDAPEAMSLLASMGIGIEVGVWTAADAARFVAMGSAGECLRVLIELTSDDPAEALEDSRAILRILDEEGPALPRLLHGENGSARAMIAEASRLGLSTRIGFEDVLTRPDGDVAPDNAALVRHARSVFGLALAGRLLREPVPASMLAVTVPVAGCIGGAEAVRMIAGKVAGRHAEALRTTPRVPTRRCRRSRSPVRRSSSRPPSNSTSSGDESRPRKRSSPASSSATGAPV